MANDRYIVYNDKKYAFDLNKIKEFCVVSSKETGKETEVIEAYELDTDEMMKMTSKTCRDVKGAGNPQNDTIMYDLVKMFILPLVTNEQTFLTDGATITSEFSISLCLNTMLDMGFLYEIKD
jgi:hypothetical protein